MMFEHTYKGRVWYCVPNVYNHAYFIELCKTLNNFGKQGDKWRYKSIKPNRPNLTLLRLSDIHVPVYNLIHCFMFKYESDALTFKNMDIEI
jgi:hypothetical protein